MDEYIESALLSSMMMEDSYSLIEYLSIVVVE